MPNSDRHLKKNLRARFHATRSGSAPFELVMVTPLLVAMFVLVLYVGNFMIGQAYVVADARNKAWHKRYTEAESKEYDFKGSRGFVEADSTQERRISSLVASFPNPKSRHVVIGDSWHARQNDPLAKSKQRVQELNSHWNSKLQIQLAKYAGVNAIDQAISDITKLSSLGDRVKSMILQMIGDKLDPLKDLLNSFQSQADELKRKLEQKKQAEKNRLQNRIQQLDRQIAQTKQQIQAKKDRIKEIDRKIKASKNADDDDDDKLTKAQIKALEGEKDRIKDVDLPRLEQELNRQEKERDAQRGLLNELN